MHLFYKIYPAYRNQHAALVLAGYHPVNHQRKVLQRGRGEKWLKSGQKMLFMDQNYLVYCLKKCCGFGGYTPPPLLPLWDKCAKQYLLAASEVEVDGMAQGLGHLHQFCIWRERTGHLIVIFCRRAPPNANPDQILKQEVSVLWVSNWVEAVLMLPLP